jgi:acyl-[acyl-carrier-protein] desaturase
MTTDELLALVAAGMAHVTGRPAPVLTLDYLRSHLDLMRGDYGRAWFAANWGYEEAKHSLALREYLSRSGARNDGELHDYAETVLARTWRAPYDDGRRMTIYGALQELTRHDLPRVPAEAVTEIDGPPGLLTAAAGPAR